MWVDWINPYNIKLNKFLCLCKNATCRLLSAGPASSASMNKSSTLPLPHRLGLERPSSSASRDREGYYSDRNELIREREREREKDRDRGYLSDHNSRYKKKSHFFFVNLVKGWDFGVTAASDWLLFIPRKSDEWTWSIGGIVIGLGKPKFSVKNTCPNATLSTTNCSEIKPKPPRWEVTVNRLNHGMTVKSVNLHLLSQVHVLSWRIGASTVVPSLRRLEVRLPTKHSQTLTLGLPALAATWGQSGGQRIQI